VTGAVAFPVTAPVTSGNHSSRVYHFGALAGIHNGLSFDRELLYAGAMFHDIGLMPDHSTRDGRC
jgi:HD superfamily phosphodiesterase